MSFPACRHAKKPSATVTTLRWLATEPFRVFFLTGALFGIAAVLLWPMLYAGWLPFHPGASHARLMVECFAGAFVVGFLGTAGPRMLSAPRLTPLEFCALLALHLASGTSHLCARNAWGDALFIAMLASFIAMLAGRMLLHRFDAPPPAMLLAATGLLCGIAGATMWLRPAWHSSAATYRLAGLLLYQGFLLGPVMGVGSFLLPRLLGGEFGEPASAEERRSALLRTLFTAASLLGSFAVEVWVNAESGILLRAATAGFAFAGIPWRRGDGTLARALVWWCAPLLLIGTAAPVLAYTRHVALDHLLFIGGFGLLCLIVASRVLFGHSGTLASFSGKSRTARWIVALVVIAAFTRASAEFMPRVLVSHHIYAAALWALSVLLWLLWHARRFFKKDPQPD